ncbi:MAG: penicillin-binding transpeptidase domain-containing protein [Bacillota bacterium]
MLKKAAIGLALVVLLVLGIMGLRYMSRQSLMAAADRTAPRLSSVTEKVNVEDLQAYFAGATGSFVLFDQKKQEYFIYDEAESQRRVSPCSTFKIPNSLIGLESGVVQDENTKFKWDGTRYDIPAWNADQTLTSAFANSVVWYYQKLAAGVGAQQMQRFLDETHYGNANMSGGLTKFWLDSSLRVSPLEQVLFLRKLYAYDLPFSRPNIDTVKGIMVLWNRDGSVLSGKTGSAGGHLAWFVGYLESGDKIYFFATKVEGKGIEGTRARTVTEAILKAKGLTR